MKFFSKEESYISKGMTLYGDLETETDITIYGTIYGNIRSKRNVTVGASARVEGRIEGDTVAVCGYFKGVINAARLIEVKYPANIIGDLISDSVKVASGVVIEGKIHAKTVENDLPKIGAVAEEHVVGRIITEVTVEE